MTRSIRFFSLCTAVLVAGAPMAAAAQSITGAGATFPNPVYTKWFDAYYRKTGVKINYQSVGSGAGIRQYSEGTVDFGATDGPMTDEQLKTINGQVHHFPTALGAVVLTWNLPAIGSRQLKFDGPTVADIFLGKITMWNDPRITALNPGVPLPKQDIIVVHRSDGSGTSYIFTDYLAKVSPEWEQKVGSANSVRFPVGLGGKGNEGVTQQVKQVAGTLGYVELIYAESNKLPVAQIKNANGTFVHPTLSTVTIAGGSAEFSKNTDFRVSITNAPGKYSYPIASFTWLLIRPDTKDPVKAKAMRDFVSWMVTPEAQDMAKALLYAPLPATVVQLVKERVTTLTSNGQPIGR